MLALPDPSKLSDAALDRIVRLTDGVASVAPYRATAIAERYRRAMAAPDQSRRVRKET